MSEPGGRRCGRRISAVRTARAWRRQSNLRGRTPAKWQLAARGTFYGLTYGALALMDRTFWSEGFKPLISGVESVPPAGRAATI